MVSKMRYNFLFLLMAFPFQMFSQRIEKSAARPWLKDYNMPPPTIYLVTDTPLSFSKLVKRPVRINNDGHLQIISFTQKQFDDMVMASTCRGQRLKLIVAHSFEEADEISTGTSEITYYIYEPDIDCVEERK